MAGKAKIRIEGEDATAAAWNQALGRGKTAAKEMSAAWKNAFSVVGVAAIAKLGGDAIKLGDDLAKAATKAGIGGKSMSELAYAAKLADVELDALSTGIKKMQVNLSEAASGAKLPVEALGALGLKIKDIKDLSADRQFETIADQISKLKDPADRARAATELFGKAGADLLPLFEKGADGIRMAREEAEKLGLAFDDKQLAKLSQADDAIKRLSASWEGFAAVLVSKVAPNLTWTLNRLAGMPLDINEQIANLEDQIKSPRSTRGMGAETERKRLQKELDRLRQMSVDQSKREMGLAGTAPGGPAAAGYKDTGAEAAAKKSAAAEIKEREKRDDKFRDMELDLNRDINDIADDTLHKDMERAAQRLDIADEWYERWIENENALAKFRAEQNAKLSEGAQIWKDTFLNAFDDMINTGKIKWSELLKYMLAEFGRRGISKLFDKLFTENGKASSGASGGGFWSSLLSGIFGAFGGKKGSGGAVEAGKSYIVGDRGAELLTMGSSGHITPNNALGGGGRHVTINQTINMNGGGDRADVKRLFREHARQLVDQLSRDHMLVGT
jgi:hypothetical protein